METELSARIYALELLTTQLISETCAKSRSRCANEVGTRALHPLAEVMPADAETFDEEARPRVGVKAYVNGILDEALARAKAALPIQRSWDIGPQAGA